MIDSIVLNELKAQVYDISLEVEQHQNIIQGLHKEAAVLREKIISMEKESTNA